MIAIRGIVVTGWYNSVARAIPYRHRSRSIFYGDRRPYGFRLIYKS